MLPAERGLVDVRDPHHVAHNSMLPRMTLDRSHDCRATFSESRRLRKMGTFHPLISTIDIASATLCMSQNQSYCLACLTVVLVDRPARKKGDERKSWVLEYSSSHVPATVRLTSIDHPQIGGKFTVTPGGLTNLFYGCKD